MKSSPLRFPASIAIFTLQSDVEMPRKKDDEHDNQEDKDDNEDDDGDAEEHVNVAKGRIYQTKFLLFIFGVSITVYESITEKFSLDTSAASWTLTIVAVIGVTLFLERSDNKIEFFVRLSGGWRIYRDPDVHLLVSSLDVFSPLDSLQPL